ncbi:phasin family protein [Chitinasiproducens palmae]|uniref:Phasin family protein n=1 Tax=Chitinasiproducens palmae TaxID=1770053 RepID=A0A1H2PTX6_9BURK|nr:phasin family protein [Chitinasiproducens palmae]SDV49751.1 phasin family protein [Chitinasiproducens palmae]
MSVFNPEQLAAAQRAQLDTLFGLTSKAFEGVEKMMELNIEALRASLSDSREAAGKAAGVKDAQELLALQASIVQPLAEKTLNYSRSLYEILSSTNADLARLSEEQVQQYTQRVQAAVENLARNAPAGSETAVAAVKAAVTTANTTYETIQKASKQAIQLAESNFNAASTAATQAAGQAASQAASKTAADVARAQAAAQPSAATK